MFDITFKEVDKLTRQAETRAHQLGPSWARQSPVSLDCGQTRVGDLILTIQLHYIMADQAMTCIWNIIIFRVKHWIELGLANETLKNLREMPNNIAYNQFPTQNKKLEGDAKWHRIQSVSHTLICAWICIQSFLYTLFNLYVIAIHHACNKTVVFDHCASWRLCCGASRVLTRNWDGDFGRTH